MTATTEVITMMSMRGRPISKMTGTKTAWGEDTYARERRSNMVVDMGGKTMVEGGGYDDHDGDDVRTEDYDDG